MISEKFFTLIQKACLPGVWSKGVALARSSSIVIDSITDEEMNFRVQLQDKTISPRVILWPKDEDWHCECKDRNDVCAHVTAAAIYLKNEKNSPSENKLVTKIPLKTEVQYRFFSEEAVLKLERWIVFGDKDQKLSQSLVSLSGGIQSGRLPFPPLIATQSDYQIDALLSHPGSSNKMIFNADFFIRLFKPLSQTTGVLLNGQPIKVSPKPFQMKASFTPEGSGFRLKQVAPDHETSAFKNGVILSHNILRAVDLPVLSKHEVQLLEKDGTFVSRPKLLQFLNVEIPALQKKIEVLMDSSQFPEVRTIDPSYELLIEEVPDGIRVTPVSTSEKGSPHQRELIQINPEREQKFIQKLRSELNLSPGHAATFTGDSAAEFLIRARNWNQTHSFSLIENDCLVPTLDSVAPLGTETCALHFHFQADGKSADPRKVLQAWRESRSYVSLIGGGFAALPKNWLFRYGDRLQALLDAKNSKDEIPSYYLPEVASLLEEDSAPASESLKKFKFLLENIDQIDPAPLPSDLRVSLREYQRQGVNWLYFLKKMKMGALLADDMGLGKTLQTLCIMEGPTLVVAPTSVLFNWAEQVTQFRPSLTCCIFHGSNRTLNEEASVTITSYALLRLESSLFSKKHWNTVVLDEAQTIKNPKSQTALAAHSLQADFKIALSGTPIENKLSDLWSQFQFLNPGLLGTLDFFQDHFFQQKDLQQKLKPFILRRLKKDVLPELPEKTEVTLYCELNENERNLYDTLLLSTRKEVLEQLDGGGGIFAALELLLRLRQACCHPSLLPGEAKDQRSSKTELLLETLEQSIELGHRSLIFSQWTSYLDLIGEELTKKNIPFLRLDGHTKNRGEMVQKFQNSDTFPVFLLSLKAGGVGLTLTAADHVFITDPWWNPFVEEQASDRAHRIGQKNPVFVHRLIARETIEEKILALQKLKVGVAKQILENSDSPIEQTVLSRSDILILLN